MNATVCKGNSYRYAPYGEHSFTFVSEGVGELCVFCNYKKGGKCDE